MTIQNAIEIVKKNNPEAKPEGYWQRGTSFIIGVSYDAPVKQASFFVVTADGACRATTPMASGLQLNKMKKVNEN